LNNEVAFIFRERSILHAVDTAGEGIRALDDDAVPQIKREAQAIKAWAKV
jgi:hypothetical protein